MRRGGVALRRRGRGALVTLGRPTLTRPTSPCSEAHYAGATRRSFPAAHVSSPSSPRRFARKKRLFHFSETLQGAPLASSSGQGFFRRIIPEFPLVLRFPSSSLLSLWLLPRSICQERPDGRAPVLAYRVLRSLKVVKAARPLMQRPKTEL